MKTSSRILLLCSCVALTCSGLAMDTGCGPPQGDHGSSLQAAIEIRFHDGDGTQPRQSTNVLRLADTDATPGPTTHDSVARILVDISIAATGQPFFLNFELTKIASDVWRAPVPLLPRNQQLHFVARALDATGAVAFSGETLATAPSIPASSATTATPSTTLPATTIARLLDVATGSSILASSAMTATRSAAMAARTTAPCRAA